MGKEPKTTVTQIKEISAIMHKIFKSEFIPLDEDIDMDQIMKYAV